MIKVNADSAHPQLLLVTRLKSRQYLVPTIKLPVRLAAAACEPGKKPPLHHLGDHLADLATLVPRMTTTPWALPLR
jgi:hypothetical protein